MNRSALLEQLAERCRHGLRAAGAAPRYQPTGFTALDALLPGGGWPLGALNEIMPAQPGIGELSLLLPALIALARSGRYLALIAPPWLPYPPALAQRGLPLAQLLLVQPTTPRDALWATEQTLRCPAFGAVLAWPAQVEERSLRRLQLAAEAGGSAGWLYRPTHAAEASSPAALRLQLEALPAGALQVRIRKVRGGAPGAVVVHPAAAA
ncbi:MAG TPA: translesion DNA synthesis-associated protein ImuA [Steroidobacteraceae bacterium]|nr:translesion DNA synthesis-associated protein ImuA [Steroidobacteraceae bacterium]